MNPTAETPSAPALARWEEILLKIARECVQEGPGFAQESVVLRRAAEELKVGNDLREQQRLLTAWQNLFRNGRLSWGYNVRNPSAPFFHVPVD
jgi:hypothetical protein